MIRIISVIVVPALIAIALLSGSEDRRRYDLVWIEPSDFNTLDPQLMSHMPDFRIASAIFEGLTRLDVASDALHPIPAAAASWDISDDRTVYTFALDPRGRWSNGDPVTANDYIQTWKRALLPENGADYVKLFHLIEGGKEFFEARVNDLKAYAQLPAEQRTIEAARDLHERTEARFAALVGLESPDPLTLRVRLVRPVPYFLDLCAFAPFYPVHQPTINAWTDLDPSTGATRLRHGWTKPPHLVGNGPMIVASWRFKREMILAPNPHFRDPSLARSHTAKVLFIQDQNTALLAFQSGAADWHSDLEVDYIGELIAAQRAGARDDVHALDSFGTYFWSFNCTEYFRDGRPNPFHDPRVRRAFTLAIDKEAIVQNLRRGAERPARAFIPPGSMPGYESPAGLAHDPARASRELADAGWIDRDSDGVPESANGEPFPTVELLITPVGSHRDVALVMARMWQDTLGVRCEPVMRETKVYRDSLKQRDYMIARGAWFGDYLDPTTFLDIHATDNGNNDRGFTDPVYDELLNRAASELDPLARRHLLKQAEQYLVESAVPILPIWHYAHYYLFDEDAVEGISRHPRLVQYPYLISRVQHPSHRATPAEDAP